MLERNVSAPNLEAQRQQARSNSYSRSLCLPLSEGAYLLSFHFSSESSQPSPNHRKSASGGIRAGLRRSSSFSSSGDAPASALDLFAISVLSVRVSFKYTAWPCASSRL